METVGDEMSGGNTLNLPGNMDIGQVHVAQPIGGEKDEENSEVNLQHTWSEDSNNVLMNYWAPGETPDWADLTSHSSTTSPSGPPGFYKLICVNIINNMNTNWIKFVVIMHKFFINWLIHPHH